MEYLKLDMPERFILQFRTEDGDWMDEASLRADEFERLDDGAYICTAGGSATWIRCVEHLDNRFIHVDGGGDRFVYRLVPVAQPPEDAIDAD